MARFVWASTLQRDFVVPVVVVEICAFLVNRPLVVLVPAVAAVVVPPVPSFQRQPSLPPLLDQPWQSTPWPTWIRHHLSSSWQFSSRD